MAPKNKKEQDGDTAAENTSKLVSVTARVVPNKATPDRTFRRGGVEWTKDFRTHKLTEAQAEAVKAESMLEIGKPEPAKKEEKKATGAGAPPPPKVEITVAGKALIEKAKAAKALEELAAVENEAIEAEGLPEPDFKAVAAACETRKKELQG